jgi:hypothetical protein
MTNLAVAAALAVTISTAAPAQLLPGWTRAPDGSFKHTLSGAVCPLKLDKFSLSGLEKSTDANTLGICAYADNDDHTAEIRIRRYVKGVGETPTAIQNDQGLMELGRDHDMVTAFRVTPLPSTDDRELSADVITVALKGHLIDCLVIRLRTEDPQISTPVHKQCFEMRGK